MLTAPGGRSYVLKVAANTDRAARWNPQAEFEALRALSRCAPISDAYGVIDPIGFGTRPPFLVTRLVQGRTLTAVMLDPSVSRDRGVAVTYSAGRWIALLQSAHYRERAGVHVDDFLAFCLDRVNEVARYLHVRVSSDRMKSVLESIAHSVCDGAWRVLGASVPCHGDFVPDNILVDRDWRIFPFDPEGFGCAPPQRDILRFKLWLQRLVHRRYRRRDQVQAHWTAFCDGYLSGGGDEVAASLAYLQDVLKNVAWRSHPDRRSDVKWSPRGALVWWDRRMWYRNWLRYLHQLEAAQPDIVALWRQVVHD